MDDLEVPLFQETSIWESGEIYNNLTVTEP